MKCPPKQKAEPVSAVKTLQQERLNMDRVVLARSRGKND